ncbi:MAG: KUP/HAK/KT family potassium transporter [Proteobacteria bacterium]|nr:KUP/HAK/KT family potassium transporter [Pseudomonadota bacterium]
MNSPGATQNISKKDQIIHDTKSVIKSFGLVFGDIGTSPIYTLTVIFLLLKPTYDNVIGVLSLIVWTLIILVSIEYGWLAMSLGEKGEGGTIVLRSILLRYIRKSRNAVFITILTFVGISLLVGDGVITPAISILSAVEGILLVPGFKETKQITLIIIASIIALLLFIFQKKGTEKVAGAFGPIMFIWFLALGISGVISIIHTPSVLKAVNPYYAFKFFYENGLAGFFVLSEVILCATGGEALYADMGHLGRKPIIRAWYFVFIALLLNYLGQGAFVINQPGSAWNVLFGMIMYESTLCYIPFLILSIVATTIASQALISGMFSIFYQGINTRLMPMFKVEYTSTEMRSQIYIGFVNWFLLVSVLFIIFLFKESNKLAVAYGLAVTGTMTLTGIMMTMIFFLRKEKIKTLIAFFVTIADLAFLISNTYKLPNGGYWSLIIAAIPLSIILIYTGGQRKLYRTIHPLKLDTFLFSYNQVYKELNKIKGTALFFARGVKQIPSYIVHTMFMNNIIYEDNIIVSIVTTDQPFGINGFFKEALADGLRHFEIQMGYMEVVDVEKILKKADINEKSIFYGLEEIATHHFIWKLFSIFKKLAPPFVQFHDLPSNKLHGVVTRIEL